MDQFSAINSKLAKLAIYWAVACLSGIVVMVVWGVFSRYVLNDPPPYVEQLALILVINVAFFGAAAVVRDDGHIGMDSLVILLPESIQYWIGHLVGLITIIFAVILVYGGTQMAISVHDNIIPILGVSESYRYIPSMIGGVLIALFALEHIIASFLGKEVK